MYDRQKTIYVSNRRQVMAQIGEAGDNVSFEKETDNRTCRRGRRQCKF
jgi:hypothetical protein